MNLLLLLVTEKCKLNRFSFDLGIERICWFCFDPINSISQDFYLISFSLRRFVLQSKKAMLWDLKISLTLVCVFSECEYVLQKVSFPFHWLSKILWLKSNKVKYYKVTKPAFAYCYEIIKNCSKLHNNLGWIILVMICKMVSQYRVKIVIELWHCLKTGKLLKKWALMKIHPF